MAKCNNCGKNTNNGVVVRFLNGSNFTCCPSCLNFGQGKDIERVRHIVQHAKKSKENGEIPIGYDWAAFWTPDCEDAKLKKAKDKKKKTK